MTKMSEHLLCECVSPSFYGYSVYVFITRYGYLCRYLVRANKTIYMPCLSSLISTTATKRRSRWDFLSHAFFSKKTCNGGDKDELRRERSEKSSSTATKLHTIWTSITFTMTTTTTATMKWMCVRCCLATCSVQFCKRTNTHAPHMLVASCTDTYMYMVDAHTLTHASNQACSFICFFVSIPFHSFAGSFVHTFLIRS